MASRKHTLLPDRLGIPDYVLHIDGTLIGYAELKAPGIGAIASRFKGHNRDKLRRFSTIPNIVYLDGNEWALYRNGEVQNRIVHISGDVSEDGKSAIGDGGAEKVERLLREFFAWEPIIPADRSGKIDFNELPTDVAQPLDAQSL